LGIRVSLLNEPWENGRSRLDMSGREYKVKIPSALGILEGQISLGDTQNHIGILVCHPHPQFGGTMTNNVVRSVYKCFHELGWPSLRFNFRGVGESSGSYDDGIGEQQDVIDAITFFMHEGDHPPKKIILVGYSFGACVAGAVVNRINYIFGYIAISYPFALIPQFVENLNNSKPKLFLMGDQDDITPLSTFDNFFKALPEPKDRQIFPNIDHFWGEGEDFLTNVIKKWVQKLSNF
jgi:alpha/beta superfamily hydrolase